MKKITLFFAILISGIAFSQFKVTDSSADWTEIGKYLNAIKLYQNSDKTKAKIWYLDFNTVVGRTNVFSPTMDYEFVFSTEPDTLDKLYDIISQKLVDKKNESLTLEFPEGKMHLNFAKSFGSRYMNFSFENNSGILDKSSSAKRDSYGLDQKRLNKLFGKSK